MGLTESIDCNNAFNCTNMTITEFVNNVNCYGYFSCFESHILLSLNSTTEADIVCGGAYSCYHSNINLTADESPRIYCNGLFSCASASSIYIDHGTIECYGEQSCSNSTITTDTSESQIICSGYRACYNGIMTHVTTASLLGYSAAQNATFYSGQTDTDLIFKGPSSGDGATVYCNIGHICTIECYNNACNNLTLNNSLGGEFKVTCTDGDSEKSDLCPKGITFDLLEMYNDYNYSVINPNLITMKHFKPTTIDNSITVCDENDTINCQDAQECRNQQSITTTNGSVCCTGYESCRPQSDIFITTNSFESLVSTRCDGQTGCQDLTLINTTNGGDIYFSGYSSGKGIKQVIQSGNKTNVFCLGQGSCQNANSIENVNNVYCVAFASCVSATIESVNNVYIYGSGSDIVNSNGININNVTANIYCKGEKICATSSFKNVSGSIYATGMQSLYRSKLENIDNNVIAFGKQTVSSCSITNVNKV